MKKVLLTLLSLTFIYGGDRFAHAGTHIWSGAQDGNWSNPANWSSGGAPSPAEAAPVIVQFPTDPAARRQTTNNIYPLKLNVLAFFGGNYEMYATTPGFTMPGGLPPFPYGGNLLSGANTNTYIDPSVFIQFSSNNTILVGTNATMLLSATLSGNGGFTKIGPGTLTLYRQANVSGEEATSNDYKGPTTVLDGTLRLSKTTGCWTGPCGQISVPGSLIVGESNATHTARVAVDYLWQIGTNCHLTVNPRGTLEVTYDTSVLDLTLNGGKVVFTPYYYWDQGSYVPAYSKLECGTNLTAYSSHLGNPAILGPGTLGFKTTNNAQASFINVAGNRLICEANFEGNTPIHKVGDGELVYSGNDGHNGDWIVERGLLAASGGIPFNQSTHSVTISNGAQVNLRGACNIIAPIHLNGFGLGGTNAALVVEHDGSVIHASIQLDSDTAILVTNAADTVKIAQAYIGTTIPLIAGPGNLIKQGRGTLELTGSHTNGMTAPLFVQQGTLALNTTQDVASVSSPLIIGHNLGDGTTAEVKLLNNNQIPTAVPITINDSGSFNVNGFIETVGPITLQGGDIKTLGGLLFLGGDVLATNGVGSILSGSIHLGDAKRTFHLAPGYGINMVAQLSDIGANHGFDVDGGGTLTLSGANTALYGPIHVFGGVLYARNDAALGNSAGETVIASGARLAIDGRNLGLEPITLSGDGENGYGALSCAKTNTLNGPITLAGDCTMNVVSPKDRLILGGIISGPGGLNSIGYGTLEMTGNYANTYSGMTTVAEGTLELNKSGNVSVPAGLVIGDAVSPYASQIVRILSANQLGHNGRVTVHDSGLLDLSGAFFAPQTIGSLEGIGPVKLGVSPLSVGGDNTGTSYGGQIFGTGSLIKEGTGILLLGTGSDQFLGATVVNGGTLKVGNSIPFSPVTVNAGAKLAGAGTVGNLTSVGGTVDPGCCPTSKKLSSKNLSLDSASVFLAEIHNTNNGQYVYASQVNVSGTVNLGNATLKATLGFNSVVGNEFTIVANDGVDVVSGTFKGLGEGATFPVGTALMQITYKGGTGNDVVLTHIGSVSAPQIGSIETLPNGQKKITGTGYPGLTYTVEASTDLKSWIPIGTATAASPGGELSFIDPDAPNFQHRFYRFLAP